MVGARGPLSGLYEAIEARLGNHDVLAGLNGRLDMLASIIFHTPDHDEGSASILEPEVSCFACYAHAPCCCCSGILVLPCLVFPLFFRDYDPEQNKAMFFLAFETIKKELFLI